jgi:hypothetical protein
LHGDIIAPGIFDGAAAALGLLLSPGFSLYGFQAKLFEALAYGKGFLSDCSWRRKPGRERIAATSAVGSRVKSCILYQSLFANRLTVA